MNNITAIAQASIQDVMKEFPDLTYFGFGIFNGFREQKSLDEIAKERKELESATKQIEAARSWIKSNCAERKTANKNLWSYSLKHIIEDAVNLYISNGSCIAAFILEGYKVTRPAGWGPNCAFNVKLLK
jgi:hypothetical protein